MAEILKIAGYGIGTILLVLYVVPGISAIVLWLIPKRTIPLSQAQKDRFHHDEDAEYLKSQEFEVGPAFSILGTIVFTFHNRNSGSIAYIMYHLDKKVLDIQTDFEGSSILTTNNPKGGLLKCERDFIEVFPYRPFPELWERHINSIRLIQMTGRKVKKHGISETEKLLVEDIRKSSRLTPRRIFNFPHELKVSLFGSPKSVKMPFVEQINKGFVRL